MKNMEEIREALRTSLIEFSGLGYGKRGDIFVVGCSTSEVIGKRIGTAGTMQVAEVLYQELEAFQKSTGVHLAFQCCEHLNRGLVVEREVAEKNQLEIISAIPTRTAGGALAAHAFQQLEDAVLVEFIRAQGGIDIGDTSIGMHIKHVAIPIRTSIKEIGAAHVTMAASRPKLIGGERAVYEK